MNEELVYLDNGSGLTARTYTDTYYDARTTISYPYSFSDMLERNMDLETKRQELLTNLDELKKLLESGRGRNIKEQLDRFDVSWCEFKLLVDGTDI